MPILERAFIRKLKFNTIFLLVYSIIFLFLYKAFVYIAPFFLGIVIAYIIKPISRKLYDKFKINKGISTLLLSFVGVAVAITFVSIGIVNITKQMMIFLNSSSSNSDVSQFISNLINKANSLIQYFTSKTNMDLGDITSKFSVGLSNLTKEILAHVINLASSIPYIMMFIVTLFVATYFIAKDLDKIEIWFYNIFSKEVRCQVLNVKREMGTSVSGYIKAYLIIMLFTATSIFISFFVFGLKYGVITGVVGAILDLIPFLGITTIYVPIIVYFYFTGDLFVAVGMLIFFIVISIIRQIIEPKLVSANIGLSPLATLAAIFIGIQIRGFIGILFCFGFICMHNILKKVKIL